MQYILALFKSIRDKRRNSKRSTQELDTTQQPQTSNAIDSWWSKPLEVIMVPMFFPDPPEETVFEGSYPGYLGEESYDASSALTPSQIRESMLEPIEIVDRDSGFSSKRSSAWAQRGRQFAQQSQQVRWSVSHENLAKMTKAQAKQGGKERRQEDGIKDWLKEVDIANFRLHVLHATKEIDTRPYHERARHGGTNRSSSAGQDTCYRTVDRPPTPVPPRILSSDGVIQPFRSLRASKSLPSMSFCRISQAYYSPDIAVPAIPPAMIGMAV